MSDSLGKTALILIDHGSRIAEANALLERIAAAARRGDYPIVEAAHMELAEPTLDSAFANCVRQGARRIVIMPYFLASGNHATNDIPRMAAAAAASHPGVCWSVAAPLGFDQRLVDVALDRAREATA